MPDFVTPLLDAVKEIMTQIFEKPQNHGAARHIPSPGLTKVNPTHLFSFFCSALPGAQSCNCSSKHQITELTFVKKKKKDIPEFY